MLVGNSFTQHSLSVEYKNKIADAAALAVVLDLRPIRFTENKDRKASFADFVFKSDHHIRNRVLVKLEYYFLSSTAVKAFVQQLSVYLRQIFDIHLKRYL